MSKLILRKDRKTGEPVKKSLVCANKANELNYLVIKAYDNEREVKQTDRELED